MIMAMMILMIMMVILIMMMINDDNLEVSDLEPALQSAWKLQVGPDSASGVNPGHSIFTYLYIRYMYLNIYIHSINVDGC